ncbi:hypothetical protein [Burkholderia sp. BCC1977]|uniref:hypothetical protein n=1 Tax=Burkholderia sp. BCC1977 TaxID=2817440 RepID=UPI002ABE5E86|nr:hypothetical protein [Burkholderia sp. BCC1977]
MSDETSSVVALIATTLLSSHKVLDLVTGSLFSEDMSSSALREAVYLGYRPWATRYPDHVFESSWQHLTRRVGGTSERCMLSVVLKALADEFLEIRHGEVSVKRAKFGAWQQSVLSRVSGLPVLGAFWATHVSVNERDSHQSQTEYTTSSRKDDWRRELLPILLPRDAVIEDYVAREGLHETHLHLNGSTHAEQCWLRALNAPKAETRDFNSRWMAKSNREAARIRELAHSVNPALTPAELYRQLVAAKHLRQWLVALATDSVPLGTRLPTRYADFVDHPLRYESAPPSCDSSLGLSSTTRAADEIRWIKLILRRIAQRPDVCIERMLHCYLLLQQQYYRLLVQSEEQFGFEQFQKLTYTDLREPAEKSYLGRFLMMHGDNQAFSRIGYLEGRFAPKTTIEKNAEILHAILFGYKRYLRNEWTQRSSYTGGTTSLNALLQELDEEFVGRTPLDRRHHRLALVAHFIKKPWSPMPAHKSGPYRFFRQRAELRRSAQVLLATLNRWPRLKIWLRGIDAAANELDAPPEIFASCFRICQRAGLSRRSYHAGEDFPHLLSGLRHMNDALTLLDLRDGDRIGHGTAMGIAPQLWIDRMPKTIVVRRGDWMLDLLSTWQFLRRIPGADALAERVSNDLLKIASDVFRRDVSCAALERAMSFRHLSAYFICASRDVSWQWQSASLSDNWRMEAQLVHSARQSNDGDVELLWEWLSDRKIWERSEGSEEVSASYLDAPTYVRLQQALMRKVAERGVIIETLPSSNVRISQYQTFSEHHALRWMRVPGFVMDGDPEIMVSLGSDDPGIFAGDLSGEFYQLYSALRNQSLGDSLSLAYLAPLNERGRKYRFHDMRLG